MARALLAAESIEGWMTREELVWLGERAAEAESIVEIGTFKGRSAKMMALMTPGHVFCVDNFVGVNGEGGIEDAWRKNAEPNAKLMYGNSTRVAGAFMGLADFIFIDGDHAAPAPADDITAWAPRLRTGGILAGHDKWEPGVAEAIDRFDVQDGPGQIWWVSV